MLVTPTPLARCWTAPGCGREPLGCSCWLVSHRTAPAARPQYSTSGSAVVGALAWRCHLFRCRLTRSAGSVLASSVEGAIMFAMLATVGSGSSTVS